MTNEATVQDRVKLDCAQSNNRLWRNNSGAMYRQDGGFVKFGLASDVAKTRSSDLIGMTRFEIRPEHVGYVVGIFTAVEIKAEGWHYSANEHESEQLNFINLVIKSGGYAGFAASVDDYHRIIGLIK